MITIIIIEIFGDRMQSFSKASRIILSAKFSCLSNTPPPTFHNVSTIPELLAILAPPIDAYRDNRERLRPA